MQVQFGNNYPTRITPDSVDLNGRDVFNAPRVTTVSVPDTYTYVVADSAADLANDTAAQLGRAVDGITRMPDQEALLAVIASWRAESSGTPSWVWSDNEDFAVLLGHFFDCPVGRPTDIETTHHTDAGPPGVGPVDAEAAAKIAVANQPSEA